EQLIGPAAGGASTQDGATPMPQDVRRVAAVGSTPLSDAGCASPTGWRLDKGYGWWDGDYRTTLYNHYPTPNSPLYDCWHSNLPPTPRLCAGWQSTPPHNPAIKAARSNHPGGVNVLFCDGHVQYVKDSISLPAWRALGTRNGDEVTSADSF